MKKRTLKAYRLPDDAIELLENAALATGLSMTDVLTNCIRRYHMDVVDAAVAVRRTVYEGITEKYRPNRSRKD